MGRWLAALRKRLVRKTVWVLVHYSMGVSDHSDGLSAVLVMLAQLCPSSLGWSEVEQALSLTLCL